MSTIRALGTSFHDHPLAFALAAFMLGGILTSAHILGAVLGLLIHALNLAWIIVGGAVFIVSVWLICLNFERDRRAG